MEKNSIILTMNKQLTTLKGFRDLYPHDKAIQNYIFEKLKETAGLFGFEEYEGPILEPIDIYLGKTSEELIQRQTFQITDKKEKTLVMRPEMTPTLARMIAQKEHELTFPIRLFNLGLRFRYEAPQKGREREFYQADFDLLGANGVLADAEILATAINIFLRFGAKKDDFVVYINSRKIMEQALIKIGLRNEPNSPYLQDVFSIIDKKEKVKEIDFIQMLKDIGIKENIVTQLLNWFDNPIEYENNFKELLSALESYNLRQYVQISPHIVRGLDYYTDLVFEVKEKGEMTRSLLGGGRYDNLVENFGASRKIAGVGFATSDVILWEFLKDSTRHAFIGHHRTGTSRSRHRAAAAAPPDRPCDPRARRDR